MKNHIVISLTGDSPHELEEFDYHHPINLAIAVKIHKRLLHYLEQGKTLHTISGMAIGADQIFALVVQALQKQGYSVTLEAAIPCANQAGDWPAESQKLWQDIVDKADIVTYISKEAHSPQLIHKRNMYLVNQCDEIIAVSNGKRGGTGNTIRYAKQRNKPVFLIDPRSFAVPVQMDISTTHFIF